MGKTKDQPMPELNELRKALYKTTAELHTTLVWINAHQLPYSDAEYNQIKGLEIAYSRIIKWINQWFEPAPLKHFTELKMKQIQDRCEYAIVEPNPRPTSEYVIMCHKEDGLAQSLPLHNCLSGCLKAGCFKCYEKETE
jgi:hypothetical protein